ncbi:MAG TPA: class I SAM-dependent methyltransferase [Dermatophilaceae bacterium]|nr:class I SAM-dependent methyltransferase [Dermatophilaceae bacterium]
MTHAQQHPHRGHDHGPAHADPHALDSFDAEAAGWDDRPGHRERAERLAVALRERLALDGHHRVLEVGAGTGLLSRLLAADVASVLVTDPSAGMVTVAEQAVAEAGLADRLTVRRLDLTSDPTPAEAPFDIAWSSLALHHVADVDRMLRRLADVLVPGGVVAIAELDADPEGAFHRGREGFAGHHGFDREALTARLQSAGFTAVEIRDVDTITTDVEGQPRDFAVFLATARRA